MILRLQGRPHRVLSGYALLTDGAVVERGRMQGQILRGGEFPEKLRYDGNGRLTNLVHQFGTESVEEGFAYDSTTTSVEQLGLHSYILVSLAFFTGIGAPFFWWLKADQTR